MDFLLLRLTIFHQLWLFKWVIFGGFTPNTSKNPIGPGKCIDGNAKTKVIQRVKSEVTNEGDMVNRLAKVNPIS